MSDPDSYVPGHGDLRYGVDHYDLDLTYRPRGNRLDGRATLHLTVLEPTTELVLDLYRLSARSLDVEGAEVARWSHRLRHLRIRLRDEVAAGSALVLHVRYGGTPGLVPGPDGRAGWEELTDGALVAAQPHGAPSWFPCNDRMSDKARYRVTVTTDTGYHVAGNGTVTGRRAVGRMVHTVHEHEHPMAPYLATVQIGRYRSEPLASTVPSWLVAPPALLPAARVAFAHHSRMTEHFERRFGPYPFERYTVVVADDPLEIPLESQTLCTFGRNHLTHDWDVQRLVAHELAHQWFGNAVTASALRDIWLHEGFACYAEWLWSEEVGAATADRRAREHHARLAALPQDLLLTDPGATRAFDDRVYKRGALALHALRLAVGDVRFFTMVRAWVADHLGGSVTTAQFETHVGTHLGADVADDLRPWLHAERLPPLPS